MDDAGLNFQLLFEESPDVLLVLLPDSPRFTAVAATKEHLKATHMTKEQILGRGMFEMFPDYPDDPEATGTAPLRASLERVLATRLPDTMAVQKYDIPTADGKFEVKYWSPRNIPVLSPDGKVMYILHGAVNVTELAHETSAAQAHRKCTAELESANRELDAFSHSVAHDLRGPLRSVEGFSEMLLLDNADELSAEGRRRLEMVVSSVRRMTQLIEDLLRLGQIGRREVRRIPFELSCVVRTVALQIQDGQSASPRQLSIEEGVNVNADPHLMQIVFENLLGNAWKFTGKRDDGAIAFGCTRVDSEICYFVRDNGAGFNMQYAEKLFYPFQRLHTETEFQGTGVGLAIVKRIVSRHGGRVWAQAEVDKGATFYFTLGEPPKAGTAPS